MDCLRNDKFIDQVRKRYSPIPEEATYVHHIFPREFFPEYEYADWNLISVSEKTHNKLHDRSGHKLSKLGIDLARRTARKQGIQIDPLLERMKSKHGGNINGMIRY